MRDSRVAMVDACIAGADARTFEAAAHASIIATGLEEHFPARIHCSTVRVRHPRARRWRRHVRIRESNARAQRRHVRVAHSAAPDFLGSTPIRGESARLQ